MIKSITINAKEWFDKVNGNSYFAGTIQVDEKEYLMPFQYGYGTQFEQEAKKVLSDLNIVSFEPFQSLRSYCIDNGIKYNANLKINCKKRELKEIETNYNQSI